MRCCQPPTSWRRRWGWAMGKLSPLRQCAVDIARAVFCDCGVDGIQFAITEALFADVAHGAPLPDLDTVTRLVQGDDDGSVPSDLERLYPNLCFVLDKECT